MRFPPVETQTENKQREILYFIQLNVPVPAHFLYIGPKWNIGGRPAKDRPPSTVVSLSLLLTLPSIFLICVILIPAIYSPFPSFFIPSLSLSLTGQPMDSDYLNSSPDTQPDWMNMRIQMEKVAEFLELPPSIEFDTITVPSPEFNNYPTIPTSPMPSGPQPTIPFVGTTTTQDQLIAPTFFASPTLNTDTGGLAGDTSPSHDHKQCSCSVAAMREMIFRIAAMQPIHIDPESVKPPRRRNVKISKDPQSVAARLRRERISERIRILQRLVPGGTKMDTASMLDEAIHYVKFLKTQVQSLERAAVRRSMGGAAPFSAVGFSSGGNHESSVGMAYQLPVPDQRFIKSSYMNSNHIC